jgi:hypothetical protein
MIATHQRIMRDTETTMTGETTTTHLTSITSQGTIKMNKRRDRMSIIEITTMNNKSKESMSIVETIERKGEGTTMGIRSGKERG